MVRITENKLIIEISDVSPLEHLQLIKKSIMGVMGNMKTDSESSDVSGTLEDIRNIFGLLYELEFTDDQYWKIQSASKTDKELKSSLVG